MTDNTPTIYIAGPFTAPTPALVRANIREAAFWGHRVRQLGCYVLVPHLLGAPYIAEAVDPIEDVFGYEWWIKETLAHLRRCDALFCIPDWQKSSGARGEHMDAEQRKQPTFYALAEVQAWLSERKRMGGS